MKLLFATLFVSALIQAAQSQEPWKNYYRSDEIQINYQSADCHDAVNGIDKRLLLLQFVNLTSKQLFVSYDKQLWYNDQCTGCDKTPEQHFTVALAPKEVVAGSCADKKTKSLYIVDKMLSARSAALTKFELVNIRISNHQ